MRLKFNLSILFVAFLGMLVVSCQKEEFEFIDDSNEEETITANSTLTNLLIRSSQNTGDFDDIIDGSSCTSIKFPYTVIANGQKVTLTSEADIAQVRAIFDQFPDDNDVLEIIFPVTVVLSDFTEVTVNSQEELASVIAACENSSFGTSLSCIKFEYPLTFFVFNANNEQTDTVTINSDVELFLFLTNLTQDDFVSISFPLNLSVNGTSVTVNNNQELTDLINNTECNQPNIDPSEFEENLTTGKWYVTYFYDDYDETSNYDGYEFTFAYDSLAVATNGTNTIEGVWKFRNVSNGSKLDLDYGTTSPFDELQDDWDIIEYDTNIIRLKDVSGGNGGTDYLTFEREPNTSGGGTTTNEFIDKLTTGPWYINLYDDDGDIETCDYDEYEFVFNTDGSATATSDTDQRNGFWTVQNDSSGLDLVLNFEYINGDDPFEDLNDDWDVSFFDDLAIELIDVSGGGGGTDLLNFGRDPFMDCSGGGTGNGDVEELENILKDGLWIVDTFLDDGDDETAVFNGYSFDFMEGSQVWASNGTQNVNGIWIVTSSNDILNFEFDMDSPLNDADDDDYKVLEYSDTSVTFVIYDGSSIEDTLIFTKL